MPSAEPAAIRERCVLLPWRFAFALYALAMMVGIHWPRLRIGVADVPAPDKILHFLAFAGLTFLLWTTGWIPRLVVLWLVAMVWTFLAELTQAIPALGRTFSWWDITAGWLGVTSVVLWLWALAPVGGETNRLRLRMNSFIVQELFTRPRTWIATGAVGGILAVVIGACAAALLYWLDPLRPKGAFTGALIGALIGGLAGVFGVLDALVRRSRESIAEHRPCFRCGASCGSAVTGESGYGLCDHCGARFHLGQWIMRADLPWRTVARLAFVPAWLAFILAVGMVIAVTNLRAAIDADGLLSRVPGDFLATAAASLLSAGLAIAARACRRNLAGPIDAQAAQCRACGHDVHATPAQHGIGRCGECGTPFVRL